MFDGTRLCATDVGIDFKETWRRLAIQENVKRRMVWKTGSRFNAVRVSINVCVISVSWRCIRKVRSVQTLQSPRSYNSVWRRAAIGNNKTTQSFNSSNRLLVWSDLSLPSNLCRTIRRFLDERHRGTGLLVSDHCKTQPDTDISPQKSLYPRISFLVVGTDIRCQNCMILAATMDRALPRLESTCREGRRIDRQARTLLRSVEEHTILLGQVPIWSLSACT